MNQLHFRMDDDLGSLQPWQIFSGLYVVFWGISAYFDHFLMTFVFCIAFGVISEIVAKYMSGAYVRKVEKQQKDLLCKYRAAAHSHRMPFWSIELVIESWAKASWAMKFTIIHTHS